MELKLVLAPLEVLKDPKQFINTLITYDITILQLVPSFLKILLDQEELPNCRSLQHVFVGGEALTQELQVKFFQQLSIKLHNLYGPTEATIDTTAYMCAPSLAKQQSFNSIIGKPIFNVQLYILDSYLQPVPIGAAGELYVGGAGIARGYLNRDDLTSARFIPSLFLDEMELTKINNAKLYKTGDLVRYLFDGNIEFLGRIDNQVKIRGFRIELSEIESVLKEYKSVLEAVVIVSEKEHEHALLIAVIVHSDGLIKGEKAREGVILLREFLSHKLPDYMIPHHMVFIESIPLTTNGKIDRNALKNINFDIIHERKDYILPRTEKQKILAEIWSKVLKIDLNKLSATDNFFALGGDSILSIQVVAKAGQHGIKVTPKQLFDNPTITELANVASVVQNHAEQGLVTGNISLTPIQEWLFMQNLEAPHHFNQAFLFAVDVDVTPEDIRISLSKLTKHHDALRLRFEKIDDLWQQHNEGVLFPVEQMFYFESINLMAMLNKQVEIETNNNRLQRMLNIQRGPLIAACLYEGYGEKNRLFITIHHLVVDGVSWRILLEDIELICEQLKKGTSSKAIKLPSKTTSYKTWANKLHVYAKSKKIQDEINYWSEQINFIDYQEQLIDFPANLSLLNQLNRLVDTNKVTVSLSTKQNRRFN